MSINTILEYLFSIPKSFYVSWRLTSLKQAFKLPILVRYNTLLKNLKGEVFVNSAHNQIGLLKIGFGDVGIYDKRCQRSILEIAGKIVCNGKCNFGIGSRLCVMSNGVLKIGENFFNTAQLTIVCNNSISLGCNVLVSWGTLIMDTDFHKYINLETNSLSVVSKPIIIDSNVWICTRAVILKGCEISNGCIIGANALVVGKFKEANCLIAGNPASVVKKNITLKR